MKPASTSFVSLHLATASLLTVVLMLFGACVYDVEELRDEVDEPGMNDCNLGEVTYSGGVAPLLDMHCNRCHASNIAVAGIRLGDYDEVSEFVDDGLLRCAVSHRGNCTPMPPDRGRIPDCDVAAIEAWLDAGALDN